MSNPTSLVIGVCNGSPITVDESVVTGTVPPVLITMGSYPFILGGSNLGVQGPYAVGGVPTEPFATGVSQAGLSHPGAQAAAGATVLVFSTTGAALVLGGFAVYG